MLLTFHTDFEQVFFAYVSTHLLCTCCLLIKSSAFLDICLLIATEERITPQDQTYCFNYLITQKL